MISGTKCECGSNKLTDGTFLVSRLPVHCRVKRYNSKSGERVPFQDWELKCDAVLMKEQM